LSGNSPDSNLASWLRPGTILPDLHAASPEGVFEELAAGIARAVPGISAAALRSGLVEREELGTTAIGDGFAIPHCRLPGSKAVHLHVARHPQGVDFGAPDGKVVHLFFTLVAPQTGVSDHLEALRAIARFLRDPERRALVLAAQGTEDLLAQLRGSPSDSSLRKVTANV
jgi:PTS system nitrogen regulatory IIA component